MAGLAGIVPLGKVDDRSPTELVKWMCELQSHRGPDERSVVELGRVVLGATHMRTNDSSAIARQPLGDESGILWLVFDGKIFNHPELRNELKAQGYVFRTATDIEVVLRAYQAWGKSCVDRFLGIFAFVVHDRRDNSTTLIRDHFGIKPLYYTLRDRRVLFASEMKPLLQAYPDYRMNKRALLEWNLYGDVLPPETLFEDILAIPPGHMLEIPGANSTLFCRRYYRPADHVDPAVYNDLARKSIPEVLDLLDNAIQESVVHCLSDEVEMGTMLSGGVDSSLITAIARRHKQITAFHLSIPDDPRMDEQSVAERVAKQLDVPLVTYSISAEAFRRELPRAMHLNEMPFWHMQGVAFYLTALQAQERGVRVLLAGDSIGALLGAEAGRHRGEKWLRPFVRGLKRVPPRFEAALEKGILATRGMPVSVPGFVPNLTFLIPLLDGYTRDDLIAECRAAYGFVGDAVDRSIHATRLADLVQWLPRFYHRGDRLGMAALLEYRNPFQDIRSVHLAINLPLGFNITKGTAKWGLKEVATRYLPREIAFRKKVAWDLPADRYLAPLARTDLFENGFCAQTFRLSRSAVQKIIAERHADLPTFFKLAHVEIWGRLFICRQSLEEVTALVARDAGAS